MAKLIVVVMNATAAQRNEITNYLGQLGGYWHWMPDVWLLNTPVPQNPAEIRDSLFHSYPALVTLVLRVNVPVGGDWAGVFPSEESDQWSEWLNQFWRPGA